MPCARLTPPLTVAVLAGRDTVWARRTAFVDRFCRVLDSIVSSLLKLFGGLGSEVLRKVK